MDRDIEVWEVRTAVHELNCKSAAGPDRVTNKALKNLNDEALETLTLFQQVLVRRAAAAAVENGKDHSHTQARQVSKHREP